MIIRCRSTLAMIEKNGYSTLGLRRLTGGKRRLPTRVDFRRADVIRERGERVRRLSISGVQDKISVRLQRGRLIITDEGGEFLLKPIPGTPLPFFQDQVPANEHVTMQIAEQVFGIHTAANALIELQDGEPAYLTRRFDRRQDGTKRPMEDFCSLAEQSPDTHGPNYKYDGSYEQIGKLIQRYCPAHRVEVEKLFRRLCFMYLIGNGDAHLKNFSVITSPDGDPVLSPAYDLLCTTIHLPDETRTALEMFADDFETEAFGVNGFYTASDFMTLADRFELIPARRDRILAACTEINRLNQVTDLVRRSFLSREAQEAYLTICSDRRKALEISL